MGAIGARVLVCGQNPGIASWKGAVWKEVFRWLPELGLTPSADVYLTHIVKCETPDNRLPVAREARTCRDVWLLREIERLPNLRVVITLGAVARQAILGKPKVRAGEAAQATIRDTLGRELLVFPLLHPAYFFRAPEEKPYLFKVVFPEIRRVLIAEGLAR